MALSYFDAKVLQSAIAMKKENEGEWIWVTGYKGTDKDMTCRNNTKFNLNEKYDMPDGKDIVTCSSGFHFCKDLKDVFKYYNIGDGNRFFKVSALVRDRDYNSNKDKFAAKSIIFTSECTADEIFKSTDITEEWSIEDKKYALEHGLKATRDRIMVGKLVQLGFTPAFSALIVNNDRGDIALAVGSQPDLSMDMKVLTIFTARDMVSELRMSLKNLSNSITLPTLNSCSNPWV